MRENTFTSVDGTQIAYRTVGAGLDAFAEFARGFGPDSGHHTPVWLLKAILRLVMDRDERRQRLALLETSLAEHEEVARLDGSYRNYAEVRAEVFVMVGEKTPGTWTDVAAAGLSEVLPRSGVKRFAELAHFAPDEKAPDIVGRALTDFFGRDA